MYFVHIIQRKPPSQRALFACTLSLYESFVKLLLKRFIYHFILRKWICTPQRAACGQRNVAG